MVDQALFIAFTPEVSADALAAQVDAARRGGAKALIILAADANGCTPDKIDPILTAQPIPVSGGVFPQLIHEQQNHDTGFIVIGVPVETTVLNIPRLSDAAADYADMVEGCFPADIEPVALLMIVDGMASRIGSFLDGVYDVLGSEPTYFGGGAGSLSFQQKPCLFSNQGMLVDHAQMTVLPVAVQLGVEHGWEKFAGPFVVTRSERNIVESIDFKPAFSVYREHVEANSGRRFDEHVFFDIAKAYPFGMEKPDGTIVVRDPITHTGENMICVGEVPSNSIVYLLRGRPERLIAAAAEGAAKIDSGTGAALLFDCISRVLFLEDRFVDELAAVKQAIAPRPLAGVLSLGEIANGGDYCLEFYNKTLVLAALD